ncbi:Vacuolar protein sorting-associated protein vts1 [Erysiphe neolycopersici]|uniref:Vacuolar protein sorting-associated protein vts1 n=1 Tax=Erysiphe neolycopersici TaxID=212602 RepID=A0A420HQM1_9PEZI|nr:Vacuolar protein sorting-associated protein vts1 [Erysiphe neolycopersici]
MQQTLIPVKLKEADLTRFINRAAQLENIKPIIAYWCEYWIVNQILSKGLHNGDPETLEFTTNLMDKLEQVWNYSVKLNSLFKVHQIKANNPDVDAILDDSAGQTYVEQFALETFQRAEKAVRANKASKQTASTFQAAATFFELINIWTTPDNDISAKVKYAKWNAVRILRAISEGKDPNSTDVNLEINRKNNIPTGESDDRGTKVTLQTSEPLNESALPDTIGVETQLNSPIQSFNEIPITRDQEQFSHDLSLPEISLETKLSIPESLANVNNINTNIDSVPEVPTTEHTSSSSKLGVVPTDVNSDDGVSNNPDKLNCLSKRSFESFPKLSDETLFLAQKPTFQSSPKINKSEPQLSAGLNRKIVEYQTSPIMATEKSEIMSRDQPITDDMSIAKAQKHARWAISALNFEDIETAIKELKEALKTLDSK